MYPLLIAVGQSQRNGGETKRREDLWEKRNVILRA